MVRTWRRRPATSAPASPLKRFFDIVLTVAILGLMILLSARLDRTDTRRPQGAAVVNDGDSITLGAERIRLLGIDAPEYDQSCRRAGADYACGRAARDALKSLIGGKPVACAGWELDRYGRLLATCTANGHDLNRTMVESGWAVAYGDFEAEQAAARKSGAGLWAGSFDRPRDWRSQRGGLAEAEHVVSARIWNWLRQMLGISP